MAHEVGHYLGLDAGGTNPSPPTIMNNPVVGPNSTCQNFTVPTTTVLASDGTKAGGCIAQARPSPTPTPEPSPTPQNCPRPTSCPSTWRWRPYPICECMPSPILVDIAGDGLRLTAATDGVRFDVDADGTPELRAWTLPGSDDAWLALDRNGNGTIDGGAELFGDRTAQPVYGNEFRYRAKVRDTRGPQVGRWAWDVFLTGAP